VIDLLARLGLVGEGRVRLRVESASGSAVLAMRPTSPSPLFIVVRWTALAVEASVA
jgi:hypothetical protein